MAVTPKIRRSYKGAPVSAVLNSAGVSSATQTSITLSASPSDWPTGKFFVVVAPGTAQEEKMCVTLTGAALTVCDPFVASTSASANGRGVDNTTARTLIAAGSTVYPVATAIDFDEANSLASTYANQGGIVYLGDPSFTQLSIGTAGQVLKVNAGATAPSWGQVEAAGLASSAVEEAKIAAGAVTESKLGTGAVTSAKILDGTIVDDDINASAAIALSKLGTGALPTSITVASANIVDGTIVDGDINGSAAIADTKLDTIATANKVSAPALNINGATAIGDDLADADSIVVYDASATANRNSAISRFAKYLFGKISGEVTVTSAGVATTTSGMVKVASGTFDTASAVFEVTGFSSTYTYYKIVFSGTRSTSGASVLDGRLYNGASGLTGMYAGNGYSDYTGGQGNAGATNNGDNFYAGTLHSSYRGMTAIECRYKSGEQFTYTIAGLDANNFRGFFGGGFRNSTTAWDRIRFTPQAGNITGEWALYGYRP